MKNVLIVSSGRTGTQFLAHYFDRNFEGVLARHEPPPRVSVRLATNAYAAGLLPRRTLAALLRRRRRDANAPLYVESNPFLWAAVDVFDEVYDDVTIIHVVRDPREQVRSSLNHGTAAGLKGFANRWVPYWYPRVSELPELGSARDAFARAAGLWTLVNRRLLDAASACRDVRVLRYEDLFDDSHSGLRRLCEIFGLAYEGAGGAVDPGEPINPGRLAAMAGWRSWTDAQCAMLHRICSPLMEEWGYGVEPEWVERVGAHRGAGGE